MASPRSAACSSSSAAKKAMPERALTVETHFLRKPGQHDVDPETHEYTKARSTAGRGSSFSIRTIASLDPRNSEPSGVHGAVRHDCAVEFDAGKDRTGENCTSQARAGQVGVGQIGVRKIGTVKIPPRSASHL